MRSFGDARVMSRPRTHYEALGVRPDASLDAIRKAYQAMVLTMHPDRAPSGSHEAFHAVQAAWETLRDAQSRKAYDVLLQGAPRRSCFPAPADPSSPCSRGGQAPDCGVCRG